ncbi:MAG: sugar phosphate isomerase/epimerase family protein [Terriglobia bacterium]
MKAGLSTHLFANQRLSSHILDQIFTAGFRQVEIFAARQHLDYYNENSVRDLAQWFSDHSLSLHSLHAPVFSDFDWGRSGGLPISLAHLEKRRRIDSMDEIKRAIAVAERLPFRFLVTHLGLAEDDYNLSRFDAAFSSLEHLKVFAKERGVAILLENMPGELSSPERLAEFVRYTRLDVKVCFDTGHAHLTGGVLEGFNQLKPLIATVHLHDNRGEKDEHLFPFEGSIDWGPVIESLHTLDGAVPALLEPRDSGPEAKPLSHMNEIIKKIRDSSPGG